MILPFSTVFELDLVDDKDEASNNLQFLTTKEMADQLKEMPDVAVARPVRITWTCRQEGREGNPRPSA